MMKRFKKLAIISDCVHYFNEAGLPVTENHIFKRQMEMLAAQFDETLICCPFGRFSQEKVFSIYNDPAVQFLPLPHVGGNSFTDKIKIFKTLPAWWKAFKKVNDFGDIIYQRFPNNVNIPGFFYFYFRRSKIFATYTGTWKNYENEPASYRFQKWLLRKYFRGPVWIYADAVSKAKHLQEGFSPSYSLKVWEEETVFVQEKINRLKNYGLEEPVFISVGALVGYKNQQYILDACRILKNENFRFKIFIIGDGPLKKSYQDFIDENHLEGSIFLAGKKTFDELRLIYRQADFILQAPLAEGFGKTPLEGFFHGVIPFLSDTLYAKKMTGNEKRGFIFSLDNPVLLAGMIREKLKNNMQLACMIEAGRDYARSFTLENWVNNYMETINTYFEN